MKKTLSTFALFLSIAALTACSTARGESERTTTLETTDKAAECTAAQAAECTEAQASECTEAKAAECAAAKAKSDCPHGDTDGPSCHEGDDALDN